MGLDEMLGGQGTVIRTSFIADSKGMDKVSRDMAMLSKRSKDFMKSMGLDQSMPSNKFKNLNKGFYNVNEHLKQAGKHAQRFKMELLGIMFFGMGLQRIFKGAIGPAADAFGLGELWDTTKLVLFLPLMEAIFPYLLGLMEFIMNLPQPVKLAVGAITLFLGAFGTLLAVFGSVSLGLASLKLAFPALASVAVSTSAIMNATLVGALIAVGFWLNSTANQMGGWGNLFKNALAGVINYVIMLSGWFGTLVAGIGELLSKTYIFKSTGDSMQMVGNKISSLAEDAAIGFQSMRTESNNWWNTTVQNNTAVGNSFKQLEADISGSIERIKLKLGSNVSSAVQMAAMNNKTAAGALYDLKASGLFNSGIGSPTKAGSYKSNPNAWKPKTTHGDFIWRAGQGAIGISPDDNLVGTKSGMGGGVTINQTINVGSAQRDEIRRMLDENNKRLVLDIKRMASG